MNIFSSILINENRSSQFISYLMFLYAEVYSFYMDKQNQVHKVKLIWSKVASHWDLKLISDDVLPQNLEWYLREESQEKKAEKAFELDSIW